MNTISERFWNKVDLIPDNKGCLNWIAGKQKEGYGTFKVGLKTIYAHRFVWILYYGNIPDKLEVCHSCDNPLCVNIDHLFLATHKQNMEDRDSKNRNSVSRKAGMDHGNSKLTTTEVAKIKILYSSGNYSQRILAKMFNVSQTLIMLIINEKRRQNG